MPLPFTWHLVLPHARSGDVYAVMTTVRELVDEQDGASASPLAAASDRDIQARPWMSTAGGDSATGPARAVVGMTYSAGRGIPPTPVVFWTPSPAGEPSSWVCQGACDLLAAGNGGHGGIDNLLLVILHLVHTFDTCGRHGCHTRIDDPTQFWHHRNLERLDVRLRDLVMQMTLLATSQVVEPQRDASRQEVITRTHRRVASVLR